MSSIILDASALLAVLFDETGAEKVHRLLNSAVISAVNLSEVAAKGVERGLLLDDVRQGLGWLPMEIVDFDADQAYIAASFRPLTRHLSLSPADRACLALGWKRQSPVLTADKGWLKVDIGVKVEVIR